MNSLTAGHIRIVGGRSANDDNPDCDREHLPELPGPIQPREAMLLALTYRDAQTYSEIAALLDAPTIEALKKVIQRMRSAHLVDQVNHGARIADRIARLGRRPSRFSLNDEGRALAETFTGMIGQYYALKYKSWDDMMRIFREIYKNKVSELVNQKEYEKIVSEPEPEPEPAMGKAIKEGTHALF